MAYKMLTDSSLRKLISNTMTNIDNRSLEFTYDSTLSRIGLKKKVDSTYTYTDSLLGKTGDSITNISINETTGEAIVTISSDTVLEDSQIVTSSPIEAQTVTSSITELALSPNVFITLPEITNLSVTLEAGTTGVYNEYMFEFTSGAAAPVVSFPTSVKWVSTPVYAAYTHYQVSIVNNIGVIVGVPL